MLSALDASPKQQAQQVPASASSDCPSPDRLERRSSKVVGDGVLALQGQAQGVAILQPGEEKALGDPTAAPRTCEGVSEQTKPEPGSSQWYVVGG